VACEGEWLAGIFGLGVGTCALITDTGNRDPVFLATPLGLFCNLPGPLPITSCVKTYEAYEMEL